MTAWPNAALLWGESKILSFPGLTEIEILFPQSPGGVPGMTNGEQAVTEPNLPPRRIAGFVANNLFQWAFYYSAVLDPRELKFSDVERRR